MDGQRVRLADRIHFAFTGENDFASRVWPSIEAMGRKEIEHSQSGSILPFRRVPGEKPSPFGER
jgi:hypothetical protein